MKEKNANKQNRKEELKDTELNSVSGGVSSASISFDRDKRQGELSVQSDSVETAVDIFGKFTHMR